MEYPVRDTLKAEHGCSASLAFKVLFGSVQSGNLHREARNSVATDISPFSFAFPALAAWSTNCNPSREAYGFFRTEVLNPGCRIAPDLGGVVQFARGEGGWHP